MFFRQNSELEEVSANLNTAKLFSYTNLQRWEDMGQCDENVMIFYSVDDNVVSNKNVLVARPAEKKGIDERM